MSKIGMVENGYKKRKRTRKRRHNSATAAKKKVSNPSNKRRSIAKSSVMAFAKRNGMKLVKKGSNPSKPKRKSNGVKRPSKPSYSLTSRNGFFGNSKGDVKAVGSVLGGGALTKLLGRFALKFANPYLAQTGLGKYGETIVDGIIALVITPFIVGKIIKGGDVIKQARLGGLLVTAIDVVEVVAPNVLNYNPFSGSSSPIVMTNGGPAVAPAAVAQIAAGVASSANPTDTAAKVGRAMLSLDAAGGQYAPTSSNSYAGAEPDLVL